MGMDQQRQFSGKCPNWSNGNAVFYPKKKEKETRNKKKAISQCYNLINMFRIFELLVDIRIIFNTRHCNLSV